MQRVSVSGKEYECYWFSGRVVSATKNVETRVHGSGGYTNQGGGYSAPVSISSTTTIHDQLFLVDKVGNERAFQLEGFNVACREGNEVCVVWAMKPGQEQGPHVYIVNRTTNADWFNLTSIKNVVKPNALGCSFVVLAAWILPSMLKSLSPGAYLTTVGFALVATFYWYFWTVSQRVKKFKTAIQQLNLAP